MSPKLTGIPITGKRVENRSSVCQRHGDGAGHITVKVLGHAVGHTTERVVLRAVAQIWYSPRAQLSGPGWNKTDRLPLLFGSFAISIRSFEVSGLSTGISVIVK
jgi:hypothetical protein